MDRTAEDVRRLHGGIANFKEIRAPRIGVGRLGKRQLHEPEDHCQVVAQGVHRLRVEPIGHLRGRHEAIMIAAGARKCRTTDLTVSDKRRHGLSERQAVLKL